MSRSNIFTAGQPKTVSILNIFTVSREENGVRISVNLRNIWKNGVKIDETGGKTVSKGPSECYPTPKLLSQKSNSLLYILWNLAKEQLLIDRTLPQETLSAENRQASVTARQQPAGPPRAAGKNKTNPTAYHSVYRSRTQPVSLQEAPSPWKI